MLGIPSCSKNQYLKIVKWKEKHVTELAEWSCEQVRNQIRQRGDHQQWVASYDDFYLAREHYSNTSSGTLYDYSTGKCSLVHPPDQEGKWARLGRDTELSRGKHV